jgi:hypothetical protein
MCIVLWQLHETPLVALLYLYVLDPCKMCATMPWWHAAAVTFL